MKRIALWFALLCAGSSGAGDPTIQPGTPITQNRSSWTSPRDGLRPGDSLPGGSIGQSYYGPFTNGPYLKPATAVVLDPKSAEDRAWNNYLKTGNYVDPLSPKELTAELLVGDWDCAVDGQNDGWIRLNRRGDWMATRSIGAGTVYGGYWAVQKNVLSITKETAWTGFGGDQIIGDSTITFDLSEWPKLKGVRGDKTKFTLTNRVPEKK